MPDDLRDRPTPPPPRPSQRRLFSSPADSKRLEEEQSRILEAMRSGVKSLIDRYFDDAAHLIRRALLRAVLAEYDEGVTRGRAQAAIVYLAYVGAVRSYLRGLSADPRLELDPEWRPTVDELQAAVAVQGFSLSLGELSDLCARLQVPLATDRDHE